MYNYRINKNKKIKKCKCWLHGLVVVLVFVGLRFCCLVRNGLCFTCVVCTRVCFCLGGVVCVVAFCCASWCHGVITLYGRQIEDSLDDGLKTPCRRAGRARGAG